MFGWGHSRRFWDVCAKSVLHSTSDIMARMQDQVSVGFTGAVRNRNIRGSMRISWEAEQTREALTEVEAAAPGGAPAKQGRFVLDHRCLERDA
jgi:hypothetical protein